MTNKKLTIIDWMILIASIGMMCFQVYTAAYMPLQVLSQRSLHLCFVLFIAFLYEFKKTDHKALKFIYLISACASVVVTLYAFKLADYAEVRATSMQTIDVVFGIILMVLLLFITYKLIGIWMPLLALVFIAYACFGSNMSGIFHFKAISLKRYISVLYLNSADGIFGSTLGVSATFVFMFILLGEVMSSFGAGEFIINITESIFGRFRGGSPKVAVVGSALFGMISGSGPANVAGTGTFTIPLMKRTGFEPHYAGAVEAAASTGGQFMPPVMGSVAFVMAEMIGDPYRSICLAALVPALIYYIGLFVSVDLHAVKKGGLKINAEELPDVKVVFKEGWHHIISILMLVYLLCVKRLSPSLSCFWAIVSLIGIYYVRAIIERKPMTFKGELIRFRDLCINTCKGCLTTAVPCAAAGIIVGSLAATGLTLRLSSILVTLASGKVILLAIMAMIGCIILGMGLPPLPVYIITGIMLGSALTSLGITKMAAHLFLLFFGCLANITPPVGISFYVAAGLAEAPPMKTGFTSWRLALPGFIIPFVFLFDNALLLQGNVAEIIQVVATCVIGVVSLAFAFEGYAYGGGTLNTFERITLGVAGLLVCIPETITDAIGVVLVILTIVLAHIRNNKKKTVVA